MTKPFLIFLAGAVVTAVLSLVAARAKAPPDSKGWRHLKPGAMHWTAIGLGGGLSILMAYVRVFVGSSRADGETQMTILTGLAIVFGLLTLATAISVHALLRRAVRWRGTTLAFTGKAGVEKRAFNEIGHVNANAAGQVVLTFMDGTFLRIDPYATGASELLELLETGTKEPG